MIEPTEKTFSVSTPARLSIANIRGSVEIRPGAEGVIHVTALKQPHTGDDKHTEIGITQEADGTVKAAARFPKGNWNWFFGSQPCEVDFVVEAPRLCSLMVNGVSNSTFAEGFEGDIDINSVSGEITLRDLTGSVRIRTVSGDTAGERISGILELETVSGDMMWKESDLCTVRANSVSGDICMVTSLAEGPYNFKSVSGQVFLSVPPDSNCTAELHSLSGDLVSTFPVTACFHHNGTQKVNIHGGGVVISLNSVSGDLTLECNGEILPAPGQSEITTVGNHLALLEHIERGEISVDDALQQLHA